MKQYFPRLQIDTSDNTVSKSADILLYQNSVWVPAKIWLTNSGTLNVHSKLHENESFDILECFSSGIRKVHHSVFSQYNILYLGRCYRSKNYHYFKFNNESELHEWLIALKNFSRPQICSPSSGDLQKSLRISRRLKIRIVEARLSKPQMVYVEIFFAGRIWGKSSKAAESKFPIWREDFWFSDIPSSTVPNITLKIKTSHDDQVIQTVTLTHADLLNNLDRETWYENNSLCLKIKLEELYIAADNHYTKLKNAFSSASSRNMALLSVAQHDISKNEITPLTSINLSIMLRLDSLEPTLRWIGALISQEIMKTRVDVVKKQGVDCFKDFCTIAQHEYKQNFVNTMFRGNTMLTKSMEKFMRILGKPYLKKYIHPFIMRVVTEKPNFEINPVKISSGESIKNNQALLLSYVTDLWNSIKNSVHELPEIFKLMFHHLRLELIDMLNQTEKEVRNSIAGFLFLRFFCPSLLNPKLFGILEKNIEPSAQRPLTLIAKIIMAFASRSRFGMKESWLIPMNSFIDVHEKELIVYFSQISLKDKDIPRIDLDLPFLPAPDNIEYNSLFHEHLSQVFLLDAYINAARYLSLWKKTIEPNTESIAKELKRMTEEISEILETSEPELIVSEVMNTFSYLSNVTQECFQCIESIGRSLKEPETFDNKLIQDYANHLHIDWDLDTNTLTCYSDIGLEPTERKSRLTNNTRLQDLTGSDLEVTTTLSSDGMPYASPQNSGSKPSSKLLPKWFKNWP